MQISIIELYELKLIATPTHYMLIERLTIYHHKSYKYLCAKNT